ncbi:MAG: pentapeptide repeat-containing protein [Anaerolineales bacterium]|nr:pentapeptide repeat-containing protein [Anaerolineales bacterium]
MSNRGQRAELRKSEWFTRWRIGKYRQEITFLKVHGKPSETHPVINNCYDFRAANLRKAKLVKASLHKCNFNEAQMYQAYLIEADLSYSQLMIRNSKKYFPQLAILIQRTTR